MGDDITEGPQSPANVSIDFGEVDEGPPLYMCGFAFLQFLNNHRAKLRDAAGAQSQNHVACLRRRCCGLNRFGGGFGIFNRLAASLADALGQDLRGDAFNWLFTGGVNV